MQEWFHANGDTLGWLFAFSVLTFVGSLIAIPLLVLRIPIDYFVRRKRPHSVWTNPTVAIASLMLKNVLGIALIAAGIAMLVFPGQGVLTILFGIMLMNFPGKRALELSLVRRPAVFRSLNWIRKKGDRPPLELPPGKAA